MEGTAERIATISRINFPSNAIVLNSIAATSPRHSALPVSAMMA
jgi:hypothetical protein